MKEKNEFHLYAMITIIFWSLAYVLTKLALQYFTTFSLGFLRYFIATGTLLVVAIVMKMKLPSINDLPLFILAGIFGFFFYMIGFNQGQQKVTASTASIVIATVPVLTALIARFVYKEKLSFIKWIAILIEFAGVAVLTLLDGLISINIGLLWLLFAALSLSIYNLLQKKLTKKYSALQTSAFSIFFGTVLLFVFSPISIKEASNAPAIQWLYLFVLGIFSSAIAYVSWSMAFAKAKQTSQVSNYMFITPFLTSIFGFLMIHEIPEFSTLIGGGIILIGVFIFNFGEKIIKSFTRKVVQ